MDPLAVPKWSPLYREGARTTGDSRVDAKILSGVWDSFNETSAGEVSSGEGGKGLGGEGEGGFDENSRLVIKRDGIAHLLVFSSCLENIYLRK